MIGYTINLSAVKNGAANINENTVFYDNNNLKYAYLQSDGLGIQ
jgi:hypothetical protein